MVPLLFDTDIGSDIDDAVALAYLLREPRCELLGITTVTGEPIERARLADAVCRAAGRTDIPIHAGIEPPLLIPLKQTHAPQKAVLKHWEHRRDFEPNTAVSFLRQTIHARPGEITLLAVGPFTNIGALFAMDPEIPSLLKRVVIMGGRYTCRTAGAGPVEWNASGDPHAMAIMTRAPVAELTAFGLDVTLHCSMTSAECRQRFQGGALDLVAEMAEVWFTQRQSILFHDPLAAVAIFDPDVCEYQSGRIEVELASSRVAGMTHWAPEQAGPHRIATSVNCQRFFELYFTVAGVGE
jgi:purine nucleosidase